MLSCSLIIGSYKEVEVLISVVYLLTSYYMDQNGGPLLWEDNWVDLVRSEMILVDLSTYKSMPKYDDDQVWTHTR
jgi:hypothetical protein